MSSRVFKKLQKENEPVVNSSDDSEKDEVEYFKKKPSIFSLVSQDLLNDNISNPDEVASDNLRELPVTKRKKIKKKFTKRNNDKEKLCVQNLEILENNFVVEKISLSDIFVVDSKYFNSDMELKRIFGVGVVNENISKSRRNFKLMKGIIVQPKTTWPPVIRFGLDMSKAENGVFSFTHNKEYRKTQIKFYDALNSMSPDNISFILSECPYHIDSLLQLSEICMDNDNSEMGIDLLQRSLHAFQSALHPLFNLHSGNCKINFRCQENRGLFVAIFRYIIYLGERGCYRSALEYCKLLLKLDPENDPLAILLSIDFFAIASKEYEFLIRLYNFWNDTRKLKYLPNFAFSVPLAMMLQARSVKTCDKTDFDKCDAMLQDALILFPGYLTRLLKHITIGGVNNLDKSKLFGTYVLISEPESLGRLLDLYVTRTYHCWQEPATLAWLERCVSEVLLRVEPSRGRLALGSGQLCQARESVSAATDSLMEEYAKKRKLLFTGLPRNVLRHLILAKVEGVAPIITPEMSSDQIYGFDPLPPLDSINIYNPAEEMRRRLSEHTGGGILGAFFASLFPAFAIERANIEAGRPIEALQGVEPNLQADDANNQRPNRHPADGRRRQRNRARQRPANAPFGAVGFALDNHEDDADAAYAAAVAIAADASDAEIDFGVAGAGAGVGAGASVGSGLGAITQRFSTALRSVLAAIDVGDQLPLNTTALAAAAAVDQNGRSGQDDEGVELRAESLINTGNAAPLSLVTDNAAAIDNVRNNERDSD